LVAERDQPEALGGLVPDPGRRGRQLGQLHTQLVDRGLRVEEAPEQEARDHAGAGCCAACSFASSAFSLRRTSASSCPKSSRYALTAETVRRSSSSVSSIVCMARAYRADPPHPSGGAHGW